MAGRTTATRIRADAAGEVRTAHAWAGKRVREDVRDGVAVCLFSGVASMLIAAGFVLAVRLAG